MAKLILFNKPFQVMSQFSACDNKETLADYIKIPDVYPAGRLDFDSEGLLLLTDNGQLQHRIAHPNHKSAKTYWVQVEGIPTEQAFQDLQKGVTIRVDKRDYRTKPAEAQAIAEPTLPERDPPIRFRKTVPDSWIELTLKEGKNRQVRKMTAAVGYPTLRLVRSKIGNLSLGGMQPSDVVEMERAVMYQQLGLMK